jgi:hypothetical protein
MIGSLGLRPPAGNSTGIVLLEGLPEPPASRFSALAVLCGGQAEAQENLDWYRTVRSVCPAFGLGLVCRPESCAEPLATLSHPLTFLLRPEELVVGRLPEEALGRLRDAGVEGRVLTRVIGQYGGRVLEQEPTLRALIARASAGASVTQAAQDLEVVPATVTRRLAAVGVRAGRLRSEIRQWAYAARVALGVAATDALKASGWLTQKDRRKAARRLRIRP